MIKIRLNSTSSSEVTNALHRKPVCDNLNNGPYTEGSIGIANIFKVLRLDFVERLSYPGHPEMLKHAIRALVILQF